MVSDGVISPDFLLIELLVLLLLIEERSMYVVTQMLPFKLHCICIEKLKLPSGSLAQAIFFYYQLLIYYQLVLANFIIQKVCKSMQLISDELIDLPFYSRNLHSSTWLFFTRLYLKTHTEIQFIFTFPSSEGNMFLNYFFKVHSILSF